MTESTPPLVLAVEDGRPGRNPLRRRLTAEGFRLLSAADAEEALALAGACAPDVVLLDADPEGAPGLEVLDRLRAAPTFDGVPVIVLARRPEREPIVGALRGGAYDCLVEPYDPEELAARVAAAVRVRRAHAALATANRRLAQQTLMDDLTGLGNRRLGARELERGIELCVRHGRGMAVVRIDVDRFKAINDGHGREGGDLVLVEVARRLSGAMRSSDRLARWGGDEFVALLPETDRAGAVHAGERLRSAVAAAPVATRDHGDIPVSVSVGWAAWTGDDPHALLARADRALHEAKAAGRDTVHPAV